LLPGTVRQERRERSGLPAAPGTGAELAPRATANGSSVMP
jgi:hypothetical protein